MKLLVPIFILTAMILFIVFVSPKKKKPILQQGEISHRDTLQFKNDIQPILVSHCSPCHFPGGKMFEKLPFDKAETVLMLNERLLKRIKASKENALIKDFIRQASNEKK